MIWELLEEHATSFPDVPDWLMAINPFELAWGPYAWPDYLTMDHSPPSWAGRSRSPSRSSSTRSSAQGRSDEPTPRPAARPRSWLGKLPTTDGGLAAEPIPR